MKKLSLNLWPNELDNFHRLHLNVVVKMLKNSHFNSKMNSLKEICKLIENSKSNMDSCKEIISQENLSEWIVNEHIVSLSVEGNIDQHQYCDKIKTIVDFMGERISNDEISALWSMQFNKSMLIIENLYGLIAIAATKFSQEQLDFLIEQIKLTWSDSTFKLHDKLLSLLRMIGRDSKNSKTYLKILEALWDLKSSQGLTRQLFLSIYSEHLSVLTGGRLPRDQAKAIYIKKCCDYIKKEPGSTIAIASLKHIYDILNSYQKSSSKSLKEVLSDIIVPIMKVLCTSLLKCHENAYLKSKEMNMKFDHVTTLNTDGIFTHEEVVRIHLDSIKFILKEGNLYLKLARAQEIWEVLIENENSCEWDKQIGYEWFIDCLFDLNDETRYEIFTKKILINSTDSFTNLTHKGYECFKLYFLRCNENESKLQIRNDLDNFICEKLDLIGINYLWDIILYVNDTNIAHTATQLLLDLTYEKISYKLKRDISQLHKKFINDIYSRIDNILVKLDNLDNAFRSTSLKCIERILMIIERYIITVEETLIHSRSNLPHYLSFKAELFTQLIFIDQNNINNNTTTTNSIEIDLCSNETLIDLRQRISTNLIINSNFQIYNHNDKLFTQSNDYKLLSNLGIDGIMPIYIKTTTITTTNNNNNNNNNNNTIYSSTITNTNSNTKDYFQIHKINIDDEKCLPSVLLSNDTNTFDMFNRLELFNDCMINKRIRNILKLIPTNPKLLESFDNLLYINNNNNNNNNNNRINESTASSCLIKSTSSTCLLFNEKDLIKLDKVEKNYLSQSTPTNTNTMKYLNEILISDNFENYFDKTRLSLSRLLYNLEALSSRLMPSLSNNNTNLINLHTNFIKSNGLNILINLIKLDHDKHLNENDYELKQDIYILLLQLIRFLIFGKLYSTNKTLNKNNNNNENRTKLNKTSLNLNTNSNKRPSSEPIKNKCSAKKTITETMVEHMTSFTLNQTTNLRSKSSNLENLTQLTNTNELIINLFDKINSNKINNFLVDLLILLWSAASGNIQLSQTNTHIFFLNNNETNLCNTKKKEVKFFIQQQQPKSQQQSQSINNNEYSSMLCLKNKTNLNVKDIKIACKSIELIECLVQNSTECLLDNLLNMNLFKQCLLDVLTGSISSDIRVCIEKFLYKFISFNEEKCKEYLINLIINARLPLWINSSLTRLSNQRLIYQSSEYFNLRCKLLEYMTCDEQEIYSIDLKQMLKNELDWFLNFTPCKNFKHLDNILLTGHLSLIRSLLTCETVDKKEIGDEIINLLIKSYLFPSSYYLNYTNTNEDIQMESICSNESSRLAAYKLLVELSHNCIINYTRISQYLIKFHHSNIIQSSHLNEWNLIPLVVPRAECGYVGLKNGGATCYMNAVLQQLYMIPGICDYLLSIEDDNAQDKNLSVYWQLQNVMAHLKESKLQFYAPEMFWKAFRMWGQEVNIREQQDAFDFFISMTDQVDEYLSKKLKKEPVFKNIFEGTFSNQFICKDCTHSYEREEVFLGLNLPVKSGNLEESLHQFVKDELLDGDNSYYCEKCNEKRSAIKRTCIKKLPKYICIQLKRFDYDWETNRSLKYDDYFEFPRKLNVSPYTYETINHLVNENTTNINYDLAGIIVHSGQANAGHYYSFIKENLNINNQNCFINDFDSINLDSSTSSSSSSNSSSSMSKQNESNDRWFKFNDTLVEEIELNDKYLAEECYGGTFTLTNEFNKLLPEDRVRYWNGYMLFYKANEFNFNLMNKNLENKFKMNKNETNLIIKNETNFPSRDSLSELTELVYKGDETGLFKTYLPHSIECLVKIENLEFCKNRAIYDPDYFQFIYEMANLYKFNSFYDEQFLIETCKLTLEFTFNTYFKTGKKLRIDLNKWLDLYKDLICQSKHVCITILNFIYERETNSNFIRHYLLECPIVEIRETVMNLFDYCLSASVLKYNLNTANNDKIMFLITSLINLLDKACIDLSKNSNEFFHLLYLYANLNNETSKCLIQMNIFTKLFCFLLGSPAHIAQITQTNENYSRRWTPIQIREFSIVYELISSLILKCNLFTVKTCDLPLSKFDGHDNLDELDNNNNDDDDDDDDDNEDDDDDNDENDINFNLLDKKAFIKLIKNINDLITPLPHEVHIYLFGALSKRFLKELVNAYEHINSRQLVKTLHMLLVCCYCNEIFSANLIHQILSHINNSSSNEVKQSFVLLNYIISIEDPLQLKRLSLILDGYKDETNVYDGLLNIVRNNQSTDAKKSYHCVKFIVTLANKNSVCKDYLLKTSSNWEWSVNWLKTKMTESNWSLSSSFMSSKIQSNDDIEIKTFQRTKSAQRTLDDATALLRSNEFDF